MSLSNENSQKQDTDLALEAKGNKTEDQPEPVLNSNSGRESRNRAFELIYNADGVFLHVFPGISWDDMDNCQKLFKRKGLRSMTEAQLNVLFKDGAEKVEKIAEPCEEKILNEEINVTCAEHNKYAFMELLPPDPGGELLDRDKIMEALHGQFMIQYGINMRAIDDLLANREYLKPVLVAQGKDPKKGEDGTLTYHFTMEEHEKTYKLDEDGRINYRDRDKIESVKEGQVLVTRTLAGPGENGMDVLGNSIPALKGKEVALPFGKNVAYSEDKLALLAKTSGHIEIINDKILISPTYILHGDVDMRSGNIEFDGDVMITGNVNSGFVVKATGNITINGVVEGAVLESGGDIILKKGIQGADKGSVHAKGSLYSLFIHRANVDVAGRIVADIILHSNIKCERDLELTDKNGLLVGGTVAVGRSLVARTIGAESGVQTKIKLGISPKKRERFLEIAETLDQTRSSIERMDRALKSTIGQLTGFEIRMEVTKKMLTLKKEQVALEKEYQELEAQITETKDGCIHVLNKIYPGARISIGASLYQVKSEEMFVTFNNRDGFIATESCRYRAKQ